MLVTDGKHTSAQQTPRQWYHIQIIDISMAPFGSAVTSGWLNWIYREHPPPPPVHTEGGSVSRYPNCALLISFGATKLSKHLANKHFFHDFN